MIPFRLPRVPGSVLIALICTGLFTGCGEKSPAPGAGGGGKRGGGGAAPVYAGQVQKKIVPLVIEAIGAVEPIRTTAVRSQVTGTLIKIAITEGQNVTQGDLLFEIDPRPFKNALQSAEADLQKSRLQLETARTQVARYRLLTTDQMVSKEQFEKISDTARSLEAEMLSNESRLSTAKLQLEFCSIRAPLTGRTGNMTIHEGDLVRANANDATSTLLTINQLNPIYVTFGVPQQYLSVLTRYRAVGTLAVRVIPPGIDEKPEAGTLTFMDNMVDSSTGTLRLKGTFDNGSQRLWPGQFATVTVVLDSPAVLTITSSAIQTSQKGQHVFVVQPDEKAELRPVVVQRIYEGDAVISSGLREGESVVVDGQFRVVPNSPVKVIDKARPAPGSDQNAKGGRGESSKGKKKEKKAT
jgi:multidrug efflux system membrane fusion protein